jgi:hypothetical protein
MIELMQLLTVEEDMAVSMGEFLDVGSSSGPSFEPNRLLHLLTSSSLSSGGGYSGCDSGGCSGGDGGCGGGDCGGC